MQWFGLDLAADWVSPTGRPHVWNHYEAPIVRLPSSAGKPTRGELLTSEFGLLPYWSTTRKIKYSTFNARSETAATSSAYRGAWSHGQRCIVPADWIVEPDWRSGKHLPTRIGRGDGQPMGIAGLWDRWVDPSTGEIVLSFTMLTVNADQHAVMEHFHKPGDEKRMVVILGNHQYGDWLHAPVDATHEFLQRFPAEQLVTATLIASG